MREPVEKMTVTIREAARLLGIGRDCAYAAAKAGKIPTLQFGRRLVVPRAAIERMLQLQGYAEEGRRDALVTIERLRPTREAVERARAAEAKE